MRRETVKKVVAFGLSAVLAFGALTGCGTGNSSGSDSISSADTSSSGDALSDDLPSSDDTSSTDTYTGEVTVIKAVAGSGPRPYVYIDENDAPTGYDIEVLKAAFELMPQYELQIENADFSAIFAGLNAGTYQIGVNNFSYNEERAESYLYSLPYDKVSYVFVYKKGAEPVTSLADAAGLNFEGAAGVSVTNAVEAWNELNPDAAINITYTESDTAVVLQHVEDGSVGFAIIDGPMYVAYQEEYNFNIDKSDIPEEELGLIADNLYSYYLLPKDQEELRDALDDAIVQLKENGTLTELSEKYFGGIDQSPENEVLQGKVN